MLTKQDLKLASAKFKLACICIAVVSLAAVATVVIVTAENWEKSHESR